MLIDEGEILQLLITKNIEFKRIVIMSSDM